MSAKIICIPKPIKQEREKEGGRMKIYIVLFSDGGMYPVTRMPRKNDYVADGCRFFVADGKTTLTDLSEWYWLGHPDKYIKKYEAK